MSRRPRRLGIAVALVAFGVLVAWAACEISLLLLLAHPRLALRMPGQLIEKKSGRRVVNMGISSYGTVRELRLLDRVDVSKATHLIIQYCGNDIYENLPFLRGRTKGKAGNHSFQELVDGDQARRRYWF